MPAKIYYEKGHRFEGTNCTFLTEFKECGVKDRVALFVCDCGNFFRAKIRNVKYGSRKSCGCAHYNALMDRNTTHNLTSNDVFHTYKGMMRRCNDKNLKHYEYYGGRGIKVCDRWSKPNGEGLKNFYEDMGERPKGLTLDRIDPDGDYEPNNCRWADLETQARNQKIYIDPKSGKRGVYFSKDGFYKASISIKGKKKNLICTKDRDLAVFCREEAELHFWGYLVEGESKQ